MDNVGKIHEQYMREKAEDAGNVVYQYEYDTPEKRADAVQVIKIAKAIVDERHKLKHLCDSEAEELIRNISEPFNIFSRTHAKIFLMMCDIKNNAENFTMLCKLAKFKRDSEEVGMPDAQADAKAHDFIMSVCARGASVTESN